MSRKLLHEPLLHFAVLGLLFFVTFTLVNDQSGAEVDEIVVDQARIAALSDSFQKTWQRAPTDAELDGLLDAWVREEVLYREGIALGYDRNDPIIRRRVAQKMSFIADGMVPNLPTDSELESWLQSNIDDYQIPAVYSLQQVYVDPQKHRDDLEQVLTTTLAALEAGAAPQTLGDSTLLLPQVESASAVDVARVFGSRFVDGLTGIAVAEWAGPVQSGYGLHFVRINEFTPARVPQLDEVRAAVERDLLSDMGKRLNEEFYAALRQRYDVRIESAADLD